MGGVEDLPLQVLSEGVQPAADAPLVGGDRCCIIFLPSIIDPLKRLDASKSSCTHFSVPFFRGRYVARGHFVPTTHTSRGTPCLLYIISIVERNSK